MKNLFLLVFVVLSTSSCMTLFTKTNQSVTLMGAEGITIYDAQNNVKIGKIEDEGSVTLDIKKNLFDKTLIAKKEGYQNTPIILPSVFNPKALWNILFWPGFLIDLGTGKINKYEPAIYQIEMGRQEE